MSRLERPGGQVAWLTEPPVLQGGQRAQLLYNAQAGPLSFMCPLPSPPTVILGHNGWLDTQVRSNGFTSSYRVPAGLEHHRVAGSSMQLASVLPCMLSGPMRSCRWSCPTTMPFSRIQ